MKRPLFVIAVFFSAGIFIADFLSFKVVCGLALSDLLVVILILVFSKKTNTTPFLYLLFFLLGIAIYALEAYFPPSDRVDQLPLVERDMQLRGEVVETFSKGDKFILKICEREEETGDWREARGRVFVKMAFERKPFLEEGSLIQVEGKIKGLPLLKLDKSKSYDQWLRTREIAMYLEVLSPRDVVIQGIQSSFVKKIKAWSDHNLSKGLKPGSYSQSLLRGMVLGDRTGIAPSINEVFMNTNTVHILSISGLHLGMILLMIVFLTHLLSLPSRWGYGVTLVSIWIYALMTGLSTPILRSVIMATFFLVGRLWLKKVDLLNSLGAAALGILGMRPFLVFDPGFQLTFLCVLSLVILVPFFDRCLGVLRIVPNDAISTLYYRRDRWMAVAVDWLVKMASASLAVWVGVMPVVAHHFEILSPVTVLANLIVVPWVGLVMMIAFASVLLGFIDWIALSLNAVNEILLFFLVPTLEWISKIPGAYFPIPKPGFLAISVYYGLMGVLLKYFYHHQRCVIRLGDVSCKT